MPSAARAADGTVAVRRHVSGGANTYTGNTIVSSGTLSLVGSASIDNSTNITIQAGCDD